MRDESEKSENFFHEYFLRCERVVSNISNIFNSIGLLSQAAEATLLGISISIFLSFNLFTCTPQYLMGCYSQFKIASFGQSKRYSIFFSYSIKAELSSFPMVLSD